MKYRVVIESSARHDIDAAYDWIKERHRLLPSNGRNPHRCVAAPESVEFEQDIGQLVHGRRAGRYRILFVVEAGTVHVLPVRHGAPTLPAPEGPMMGAAAASLALTMDGPEGEN